MTVSRTKGSVLFAFGCIIMCKKNKYSSGCYICSHFSFPSRHLGREAEADPRGPRALMKDSAWAKTNLHLVPPRTA